MHQLSKIAVVGMLTLAMPGCGMQTDSEQSTAATPSTPEVVVEKEPAVEPFDQPSMVPQQPKKSTIASAPSLIEPTNGNQRAKQVPKGRQDPFAGLFVQAIPSVPTTKPPQRIVQPPSPLVTAPQPVAIGSPNPLVNISPSSSQTSPSQTNPLPPVEPSSTPQPVLPPLAQEPDLARGVAVTGVIQIGSEPQAIIKVPNETTSRYVRVGQRLSNGQVLVKRIEINENSEPVVILEQYGIEVARAVGEEAANSESANTPTAATPVPSLDNSPPPPPPDNSAAPSQPAELVAPPPPDDSPTPPQPTEPAAPLLPPDESSAPPQPAESAAPLLPDESSALPQPTESSSGG